MYNSKSLTHRLQHNSYQGQDVDLFHRLQKMSLCPLATKLSLYFQPLAATDLFLHFSDYYINRIIKYAAFWAGFFHLEECIWDSSRVLHASVLFTAEYYSFTWMYHSLFIHLLKCILSCFQFRETVNKAATGIQAKALMWSYFHFCWVHIQGWYFWAIQWFVNLLLLHSHQE